MLTSPFYPLYPTVNVAVTATSATVQSNSGGHVAQYLLTNVGTNVVFVTLADPTITASPTATTGASTPILPNSYKVLSGPVNALVAAVASATGNTLYITPGEGL